MFSICETLDRLTIAKEQAPLQQMIVPKIDRDARTKLYEYIRANRRVLVDAMLANVHPSNDEPTFASSLFFAGFLDRLCQALQRNEFLPLELWVKALALDEDFESSSSRALSLACSIISDSFKNDSTANPSVSAYLTVTAVELETTFVNARLKRQGTPRVDTSKLIPADHVLDALVAVIRTFSDEAYQHARAVSALCGRIGGALQMSADQTLFLERAGLLCGIGKIGIPASILGKPETLSTEEWSIVTRYPAMGASILRTMPALAVFAPVIRAHRERLDGRGYPDALGAHDIPVQAKIAGVADAFHAMMSERPYRQPLSASDALDALKAGAGVLYDSDIVHTLVRLIAPASRPEQHVQIRTS